MEVSRITTKANTEEANRTQDQGLVTHPPTNLSSQTTQTNTAPTNKVRRTNTAPTLHSGKWAARFLEVDRWWARCPVVVPWVPRFPAAARWVVCRCRAATCPPGRGRWVALD